MMTDWSLAGLRFAAEQVSIRENSGRWERGDLLLATRERYGDEACADLMEHLADRFGLGFSRMNAERWLSGCYPPITREMGLSWTHHRIVATMTDPARRKALEYATEHALGTRAFEEWIRGVMEDAAGELPFADPVELERDAYVLRRLAEVCDDVPEALRSRIGKAAVAASDEWYDAQTRASSGMAA